MVIGREEEVFTDPSSANRPADPSGIRKADHPAARECQITVASQSGVGPAASRTPLNEGAWNSFIVPVAKHRSSRPLRSPLRHLEFRPRSTGSPAFPDPSRRRAPHRSAPNTPQVRPPPLCRELRRAGMVVVRGFANANPAGREKVGSSRSSADKTVSGPGCRRHCRTKKRRSLQKNGASVAGLEDRQVPARHSTCPKSG